MSTRTNDIIIDTINASNNASDVTRRLIAEIARLNNNLEFETAEELSYLYIDAEDIIESDEFHYLTIEEDMSTQTFRVHDPRKDLDYSNDEYYLDEDNDDYSNNIEYYNFEI